jgi:virulence-associated protein VapD
MEQRKKKTGNRKQITFDLSHKALAAHYPRPKTTINPEFYKKAYSDISRFMRQNGFEHRQFSVYTSDGKITDTDINILMDDLAKRMPWLTLCVNQIDVTNIGSQHSLLQTLETATALQVEQAEPVQAEETGPTAAEPAAQAVSAMAETSIKERMAAARTEACRRAAGPALQKGRDCPVPSGPSLDA